MARTHHLEPAGIRRFAPTGVFPAWTVVHAVHVSQSVGSEFAQ
ncbi:hypothetical protein [Erythrobacter sp.]|nr:hypothetical protein [Erythrobacter sp.]